MGIVLISGVSWVWYRQSLDLAAVLGISLILLGVVIVNVFSRSMSH
jgi:small multidrug resistance pump